jgi:hypothetical protein
MFVLINELHFPVPCAIKDASAGGKMCTSYLRMKHQKSMMALVENAAHSDVVLVSAEKEELQAHKGILAAHSRVNLLLKKIFPNNNSS